MNRYKLTKAGVNPNEGIARFSGKTEIYEKMLYKFPSDEHYQNLHKAIADKNVEEAFQCAHALKGITGNLSMTTLYEALYPMVEELRVGSMEHAEEYMVSIDENYKKVVEAIGID